MKNVGKLRRPLRSERLLAKRKRVLAFGAMLALGAAGALALLFAGCGGGGSALTPPPAPAPAVAPLEIADVEKIIRAAVNSTNLDMVVAVVDRAGFVLGVYRTQNAPASAIGNFGATVDANDLAVALARTGAFFSNDEAPLSSRTVRFISGIHFPAGVENQPPAGK